MKMNKEISTIELVDLVLAYLIKFGAIVLLKVVLMSIGTQYDIPFLVNLSWKYFFGIIAVIWLITSIDTVKTAYKQDSEEKNPFPQTTRSVTHLMVILMYWGIFSIIAQLF